MFKTRLTIYFLTILIPMVAETYAGSPAPRIALHKRMDIKVRQLTPIAFGIFASYANGGSIAVDANSGTRRISGSVSALSGGDYGQAEFMISGQPGEEIVITPPASTALSSGGNGGNMTITDFKVTPANIITLDRQGIAKVKIGGVLKIPGSIPQGNYSGMFSISARYTH